MNVLSFDTSSDACSVSLRVGERTLHDHRVEPRQQARLLLPIIDALENEAGIEMQDIDAVIYGCGPGSFTGVRIAVAAAQGISLATDAGTLGISSLAAIAQSAHNKTGAAHIVASLDARMSEVYVGRYVADQATGLMRLCGKEEVAAPECLDANPEFAIGADEGWLYAGTGAERYSEHVRGVIETGILPTAQALLQLAGPSLQSGVLGEPGAAIPIYLRDKVALTEKERGVG